MNNYSHQISKIYKCKKTVSLGSNTLVSIGKSNNLIASCLLIFSTGVVHLIFYNISLISFSLFYQTMAVRIFGKNNKSLRVTNTRAWPIRALERIEPKIFELEKTRKTTRGKISWENYSWREMCWKSTERQ